MGGGKVTGETEGELTCEGVNNETDNHRNHRDRGPVRKPLVLHAAVDGDGSLMALQEEKLLCYVEKSVEKVTGRNKQNEHPNYISLFKSICKRVELNDKTPQHVKLKFNSVYSSTLYGREKFLDHVFIQKTFSSSKQ